MVLYLKQDKKTIVEVEITDKDLHSSISIEEYSKLLLNNLHRKDEVIEDFTEVDELRGWYWEVYQEMYENPTTEDCIKEVKKSLIIFAEKYELAYNID